VELIRCAGCGHVLGERVAGEIVVRHRGREIVGRVASMRCERCGAIWKQVELVTHGPEQADEDRGAAAAGC
jgi:uncharacterized Zn finger protein